jgi:hypothetical protein
MVAGEQTSEAGAVARAYFEAVAARDLDAMVDSPTSSPPSATSKVDLSGCDMLTIRNGKIHRNDAYMNGAQMAQQLGAPSLAR